MDCVVAEIKSHQRQKIRKVLSNSRLFKAVEVEEEHLPNYNPDHNLDENGWFKIANFSEKPFCIDICKAEFDSKEYDNLEKDSFSKIAYLLAVQGNDLYFQKTSPSRFVCKKAIVFGDIARLDDGADRLVINDQPDAVYFKEKDLLIFRSLATISSIFKGIDSLYKEATNAEVAEFLGLSFLSLGENYNVATVSTPNRKRVALAMATLAKMSPADKIGMVSYVSEYCSHTLKFNQDAGNFEISKDDELKLLLYGIEQRFYTTPFGKERRLANSVQPV